MIHIGGLIALIGKLLKFDSFYKYNTNQKFIMIHIGGMIALIGKLLKFLGGFIALIVVIRSDLSLWPGIGLFIGVTLAASLIGFVLQAAGLAILAANDN